MDEQKQKQLTEELMEVLHGMHRRPHLPRPSEHMRGAPMLMHYLKDHGGEATPGEISRELGTSTARITAVLGSLEKKGLLERSMDSRDRRKILVALTQAGWKQAEALETEMLQTTRSLIEYMGEEDTETGIRLLKKLQGWNPQTECVEHMLTSMEKQKET